MSKLHGMYRAAITMYIGESLEKLGELGGARGSLGGQGELGKKGGDRGS